MQGTLGFVSFPFNSSACVCTFTVLKGFFIFVFTFQGTSGIASTIFSFGAYLYFDGFFAYDFVSIGHE